MTPPGLAGFSPRAMTYSQGCDESCAQDEFCRSAIAGVPAHESCQAFQRIIGTAAVGWLNKIHCVEAQLAVAESLDPIGGVRPWYRQIIANIAQDPSIRWWD